MLAHIPYMDPMGLESSRNWDKNWDRNKENPWVFMDVFTENWD
jgi:hypothetical protein